MYISLRNTHTHAHTHTDRHKTDRDNKRKQHEDVRRKGRMRHSILELTLTGHMDL